MVLYSFPLVKSVNQINIFLSSQPKHNVVGTQKNHLNEHLKNMVKLMDKKNIYNFTHKKIVCQNLWVHILEVEVLFGGAYI